MSGRSEDILVPLTGRVTVTSVTLTTRVTANADHGALRFGVKSINPRLMR
jgi:hypothetical protein